MAALLGPNDEHLTLIRAASTAGIVATRQELILTGEEGEVGRLNQLFAELLAVVRRGQTLAEPEVKYSLRLLKSGQVAQVSEILGEVLLVSDRGKQVKPRTPGQRAYVQAIQEHDLTFAVGPAGTGKTYLAMAMAVRALKNQEVSRIILVRPAVEAGERLGFLPGDLQAKVDPYLRPLYDALYDLVSIEKAQRYIERNIVEVAPLAYMRGRTLNDSFIILDEAQNTTPEQMKMFLTRMGFGAKVVVTGDITQIDLPQGRTSGLKSALYILRDTPGIAFIHLRHEDVVRHELVQRIVQAYERYEQSTAAREARGGAGHERETTG
jgi:phosphate starvation-inducible PhoH-like protein